MIVPDVSVTLALPSYPTYLACLGASLLEVRLKKLHETETRRHPGPEWTKGRCSEGE